MTETELHQYICTYFPQENTSCEWKEMKNLKHSFSGKEKDDVISYISAISNMEGGYLLIGIEDQTKNIIGTDLSQFAYNKDTVILPILEQCTNLPSEGLKVEEYISEDTNKTIWIIHIPKHSPRQPVYAHKKAWQRIEDSLVELRQEHLVSILQEPLNNSDWSAEIIPEATIEWLDPNAILKAREGFLLGHPDAAEKIGEWSDSVFLDKAKITLNGKITRTALLLLGKDDYQPSLGYVAQIVWKLNDNDRLAGDIVSIPFLLATDKILNHIRNYRFKIYPRNTLIPIEIWKYDTKSILEGLHNCIAHQDYTQNSRIVVTEYADELVFENAGSFYCGQYEDYIDGSTTPIRYRNLFLVRAMVNLKMIDTQGLGIHSMFVSQRKRYLPMPDYDKTVKDKVILHMPGTIIDENYSLQLIEKQDVSLMEAVLLDRVQKHLPITTEDVIQLRKKKLVEGRKNNLIISKDVAQAAGVEVKYSLDKGLDDKYYKDMLMQAFQSHKILSRKQIDSLLWTKLPEVLTEDQKYSKIGNLLTFLRKKGCICTTADKSWKYIKPLPNKIKVN